MTVFNYTWGTERPQLHEARHLRLVEVHKQAALARLRQTYEAGVAQVERDAAVSAQRVEIVRLSTPGGRYNSEVAASVAAQFGFAGSCEPVKRGRGRPRKYGSDDLRPARPSRAKTAAGRLRAASMTFAKRGRRPAEVREHSGTVSPVTASPARSVAPKAAAEVGKLLLETTAQQADVASTYVEVTVTEEAIVAEPGTIAASNGAELAEQMRGLQSASVELFRQISADGAELSEEEALMRSSLMRAHMRSHAEDRVWYRGKDGAAMHDYDFSDPLDEAKLKPEVRHACKGFGLSRHKPTFDENNPDGSMPVEDLEAWMKAAYFNGVDFPEADFAKSIETNRNARTFYRRHKWRFEPMINEERCRIRVWPWIERRLRSVEYNAAMHVRGEIDFDLARIFVAWDDVRFLSKLGKASRRVYMKIVDAMEWFEGYSRVELHEWAGSDPHELRIIRDHQGFPKWAFPERLHGYFGTDDAFVAKRDIDYQAPSTGEMIEFARRDRELQIDRFLKFDPVPYHELDVEVFGHSE